MKNAHLSAGILASCLCFASCGSAGVHHKDAADVSQRRSTTEFDPKDIADVSAELAESLLAANILKNRGPGGRSVIVISTFRNNTDLLDFDPNVIFDRIQVKLNKSGVAYCYGGVHGEGYESKLPKLPPQYMLSMELSVDHDSVGRSAQKNYHVHMTVNDIRSNLAIWEDEKKISINGTRASAGF